VILDRGDRKTYIDTTLDKETLETLDPCIEKRSKMFLVERF